VDWLSCSATAHSAGDSLPKAARRSTPGHRVGTSRRTASVARDRAARRPTTPPSPEDSTNLTSENRRWFCDRCACSSWSPMDRTGAVISASVREEHFSWPRISAVPRSARNWVRSHSRYPANASTPSPTRRTPETLSRGSRSTERPLSRRKSRQQSGSAIPAWARTARKARNDRRRGRSRMPRTLGVPRVAIRSGSAPESAPPLRT